VSSSLKSDGESVCVPPPPAAGDGLMKKRIVIGQPTSTIDSYGCRSQ
jgi:hypothetical protein